MPDADPAVLRRRGDNFFVWLSSFSYTSLLWAQKAIVPVAFTMPDSGFTCFIMCIPLLVPYSLPDSRGPTLHFTKEVSLIVAQPVADWIRHHLETD
jgi:hypothetical protein